MKKIVSIVLVAALFAAMIFSVRAADGHTDRIMTFYIRGASSPREIYCRFYDDMPGVPYISLWDYFTGVRGQQDITFSKSGSVYTATHSETGALARYDSSAGTVTFPNLPAFFRLILPPS